MPIVHSIPPFFRGSFAVDNAMGITWGPIWGSFEVWGSSLLVPQTFAQSKWTSSQSEFPRKTATSFPVRGASFCHGKHTPPHRTSEWLGARCSVKLALLEILKSFLNGALTRGRFYLGKANIHWWWVEFNLYFVVWFEHKPGSLFSWVAGCGFSSDGMFLCKMNIKICLEDLLSFCCSEIV